MFLYIISFINFPYLSVKSELVSLFYVPAGLQFWSQFLSKWLRLGGTNVGLSPPWTCWIAVSCSCTSTLSCKAVFFLSVVFAPWSCDCWLLTTLTSSRSSTHLDFLFQFCDLQDRLVCLFTLLFFIHDIPILFLLWPKVYPFLLLTFTALCTITSPVRILSLTFQMFSPFLLCRAKRKTILFGLWTWWGTVLDERFADEVEACFFSLPSRSCFSLSSQVCFLKCRTSLFSSLVLASLKVDPFWANLAVVDTSGLILKSDGDWGGIVLLLSCCVVKVTCFTSGRWWNSAGWHWVAMMKVVVEVRRWSSPMLGIAGPAWVAPSAVICVSDSWSSCFCDVRCTLGNVETKCELGPWEELTSQVDDLTSSSWVAKYLASFAGWILMSSDEGKSPSVGDNLFFFVAQTSLLELKERGPCCNSFPMSGIRLLVSQEIALSREIEYPVWWAGKTFGNKEGKGANFGDREGVRTSLVLWLFCIVSWLFWRGTEILKVEEAEAIDLTLLITSGAPAGWNTTGLLWAGSLFVGSGHIQVDGSVAE